MKTVYIYTLSDKLGTIRYVGKTQYLKQRLYAHIKECKSNNKSHKISWIKSLLNNNERPQIEILDIVPESEWEYWEKYWIAQLRAWGFNLTNISLGGYGGDYKRTEIIKQKINKSKIGIPLSEFHKKKISKGVKDKFDSNPNYNKCQDKIHNINKDELYQKYIVENLSLNKCAVYFNTSKCTIFRNISDYGFKKSKSDWYNQLSTIPKIEINQYDLEGNLIKEWLGAVTIQKELGIDGGIILNCCKGRQSKSHGFIWRFKEDDNIIRKNITGKEKKSVLQIKDGDIINRFDSIADASRVTSIQRSSISYCCRGILKTAGGYNWNFQN
jgi:GIY-YIG catalytic domain